MLVLYYRQHQWMYKRSGRQEKLFEVGGKTMIRLKDLIIDSKATLGRRIVLTNIAPKYVYEGGKKTDKVEGCYYTVFC